MMQLLGETKTSFCRINWRLYLTLLITAAFPIIYTTTRIHFLGDLPNEWGFNIASQLAWVNLGLEVIQEAILLPLFYLLGKSIQDSKATINKLKTGLLVTFIVFALAAGLIVIFAELLVNAMAQATEQVPATIEYIRLEMIAATLFNSVRFLMIFFVLLSWQKVIYSILGIQVITSITLDTLLLSKFEFSHQMGVNGIAYSNIVASLATLAFSLLVINKHYRLNKTAWFTKPDFSWLREWWAVGQWSGVDSLIRNAFFLVFIIRMINVVEEQGTFWVVNGFIWGWLLLPFLPLADLVKQDTAQGQRLPYQKKMLGYFAACIFIASCWLILIPGFGWFFEQVLNVESKLHVKLVVLFLPFYLFFMLNTTMDSVLYGQGRTSCLALQSLITNVTVYGSAYFLYLQGIIQPTLIGIVLLFGIGIFVDTLVTWWLYKRHLKQVEYFI